MIELCCAECGKKIERERRDYNQSIKRYGEDYKTFYSRSCSAIYYNARRTTSTKGVMKDGLCIVCNKFVRKVSININPARVICDKCVATNVEQKCYKCDVILNVPITQRGTTVICDSCSKRLVIKPHKCKMCEVTFDSLTAEYCDNCRSVARSNAGIKAASTRNKRSKNEIYFGELLKQGFPNLDIKFNEPILSGNGSQKWDADVIIREFKLAVCWNGLWHYQQIGKKHSLVQVQSRDKIKAKVIKNLGFKQYIVIDLEKYNPKFVEEEFAAFIGWLKLKGILLDVGECSPHARDRIW